jgi:phosphatidylethanolamine-binding protein
MRETKCLVAVAAAVVILAFAGTASKAADVFTLKSTTFEEGKIMPKRVANSKANQPNNPNCVGDNVSPQFSWSNVPEGAKSFVLTMFIPRVEPPLGSAIGSPTAYPRRLPVLPRERRARHPTTTSAVRARWALAITPGSVRPPGPLRTTTRLFSLPRTSTRRNLRPA